MARHKTPKCWSCGYELTGMTIGDICPECGRMIEQLDPPVRDQCAAVLSLSLGILAALMFAAAWASGVAAVIPGTLTGLLSLVLAIVARRGNRVCTSSTIDFATAGLMLGFLFGLLPLALFASYLLYTFIARTI